jgi:acetyl esterase/lipase
MRFRLPRLFALAGLTASALLSQEQRPEIPLWQNGAPGFESRKNEPAEAKDYWIRNIHNPTVTLYLPSKEKATGAAVVICPGGGHRLLVFNAEGREPGEYLAGIGVAAFALKYRLAREEGSPYSLDKHPLEDGQRAMRLVRSRAQEWGIDPARIGIMGFSAGGEVASLVAFHDGRGNPSAPDPIDRESAHPDFLIQIYPGPLGIPDKIPAFAPPAFLLAANEDPCCSSTVVSLLDKYRAAKLPVEAHIYTQGAHGFNMGNRSPFATLQGWPLRMADWMADNAILRPAAQKTAVGNDTPRAVPILAPVSGKGFDDASEDVLSAMRKRAAELAVGGVALVAWFEGESIQSWKSRMAVVGKLKNEPTQSSKGSNLLAIAYSKAAEMADTLKASGSNVRPPMTGEVGWQGGIIVRGQAGYWIAAFSGGKSEEDVAISQAGLEAIR